MGSAPIAGNMNFPAPLAVVGFLSGRGAAFYSSAAWL
jgi:hypothetical protein